MEITPFSEQHLERAAALVAAAATRARSTEPLLPPTLEDPDAVLTHLLRLLPQSLGMAALDGSAVVGFLLAMQIPLLDGPGAYVPEWGHGVDPHRGAALYRDLYAGAAGAWARAGRRVHAVTLFASDAEAHAVWFSLGFGAVVADTIRDLQPLPGTSSAAGIRRATTVDAPLLTRLDRLLDAALAAPPTFRVHQPPDTIEEREAWLAEPLHAAWLAFHRRQPVGFVAAQPAGEVPAFFDHPTVARIGGAYVSPGQRRRGVGSTLLAEMLAWAWAEGFDRCTLDHETANLEGSSFWDASGFRPALLSVARHVAPSLVGGPA